MVKILSRFALWSVFFVVGLLPMYFLGGYLTRDSSLATTALKHSRLDSLASPKLILVGGSSVPFGTNSRMLQDSLGIPVVNMGIQGSIGLRYMFEEIKDNVEEGDIIFFLGEHVHYHKINVDGENTLYRLVSTYPKGIQYLTPRQIALGAYQIGPAIGEHLRYIQLRAVLKPMGKKSYYEQTNYFGDWFMHRGKASIYKPKKQKYNFEDISPTTFELLRSVDAFIEERGAHFVVGCSPVAQTESDPEFFDQITAELEASSLTLVGDQNDYVFPDSFFYDTPYHLTYEKRDVRTQMLIRDLRAHPEVGPIIEAAAAAHQ
jgi:hypothetical protein